jgi:L-rhamnose mutarotase
MNEKERFLVKVWPRITEFLDRFGSANYTGYIGSEKQGWFGPYIWSENGDTLSLFSTPMKILFEFNVFQIDPRVREIQCLNKSALKHC